MNIDYIVCTFLDLSNAFDSVSHQIFLNDLENIGIRGKVLKLYKSYLLLVGRMQMVIVGTASSKKLTNAYGVP